MNPPLVAPTQAHQLAADAVAEEKNSFPAYIDDTNSPAIRCMTGSRVWNTAGTAICCLWQACACSDTGTGTSDVPS